jgi:hypothetical protein
MTTFKKHLRHYINEQPFMFTLDGHNIRFDDLPTEMQFMTMKKFALRFNFHMLLITTDNEIIADCQSEDMLSHQPCESVDKAMRILIEQFEDWYNERMK